VAGCVAGPAALAAIAAAITYKLSYRMAVKIDGLQTLREHARRLELWVTDAWQILLAEAWPYPIQNANPG
jgi:hypothetical protein